LDFISFISLLIIDFTKLASIHNFSQIFSMKSIIQASQKGIEEFIKLTQSLLDKILVAISQYGKETKSFEISTFFKSL